MDTKGASKVPLWRTLELTNRDSGPLQEHQFSLCFNHIKDVRAGPFPLLDAPWISSGPAEPLVWQCCGPWVAKTVPQEPHGVPSASKIPPGDTPNSSKNQPGDLWGALGRPDRLGSTLPPPPKITEDRLKMTKEQGTEGDNHERKSENISNTPP